MGFSQHIVKIFNFTKAIYGQINLADGLKKYAHQCLKYAGAQFLVGN
jgi:hypothetical protein